MYNISETLKRRAAGIMLGLALLLAVGSPAAFAQEATPGTAGTTPAGTTAGAQQTDNDDDGFPWGLLGLLGLAGLAGLRPHRHDIERVDSTPGTR